MTTTSLSFIDFKRKFLVTNLPTALTFFTFLQQNNFTAVGEIPEMLGSSRDATGALTTDDTKIVWKGNAGKAASSYFDPVTKQTINAPATGDPSYYYIWMRVNFTLDQLVAVGYSDATYGFSVPTDSEIETVLGIWE